MSHIFHLMLIALLGQPLNSDSANLTPRLTGPGLTSNDRFVSMLSINRQIERFLVQVPDKPMDKVRLSPKYDYKFSYITPALARVPESMDVYTLRFRVYSQSYADKNDVAPSVARQLLRQWEFNINRFNIDHNQAYFSQLVDVYLSEGGKAGGEQLFMPDKNNLDRNGNPRKSNIIYIFDLASFNNALEQTREIAHEYGHATMPPVGGYSKPESWANGDVGERIYLKWFLEEARAGRLKPADMMGTTTSELDVYVKNKINPLVTNFANLGPIKSPLKSRNEAGFNAYVSIVMFGEAILPTDRFRRWMSLGPTKAENWPGSLADVMNEQKSLTLTIPPYLAGKTIWLPVGTGTILSQKVLAKSTGWVQIKPTTTKVTVSNPKAQ